MWWSVWWVWILGAVIVGFLEVLAPAQVFLGFAFGAAATGLVLLVGGPLAAALSGSLSLLLLVFAGLSLVSWIVLRRLLGVRPGQVKIIEHDVNDN